MEGFLMRDLFNKILVVLFILSCFSVLGCYLAIGTYRTMHQDLSEEQSFKNIWVLYAVEVISLLFVIFVGKRKDLL